ncbi:MAG: PIN domain-containing protein [Caldimonas sp.]
MAGRTGAPAALLDSGVLIAVLLRNDPYHAEAVRWFAGFRGVIHTTDAVLTETAFFVSASLRSRLAELAAGGVLHVHGLDAAAHARMADLFRKYADQDPDWADLALVCLAERLGVARIATLDITDFGVYRINGRKRFELELLR